MLRHLTKLLPLLLLLTILVLPSISIHAAPPEAYWVGGPGNWEDATNHWATTSNGLPDAANLPDLTTDVYFDSSSCGEGAYDTITIASGACKNMTLTGIDSTAAFSGIDTLQIYGNFVAPAGLETSIGSLYFYGSDSITFSSGTAVEEIFTIVSFLGTLTLLNTVTINGDIESQAGTINFGSAQITAGRIYNGGGTINFNTSTIVVNGILAANDYNDAYFNFNSASVTVLSVDKNDFDCNGAAVDFGSAAVYASVVVINCEINFGSATFPNGITIDFIDTGIYECQTIPVGSAGNIIVMQSVDISLQEVQNPGDGTFTIYIPSGIIISDYLSLTNSTVRGDDAIFYAGSHSIDNGGNDGWIFSVPSVPAPVVSVTQTIARNIALAFGVIVLLAMLIGAVATGFNVIAIAVVGVLGVSVIGVLWLIATSVP